MALPTICSSTAPPLVSYNYTDIASGTASQRFYALTTDGGYYLSSTSIDSNSKKHITTGGLTNSGADITLYDHDYDITFLKPADIKGTAIVSGTLEFISGGTGTLTTWLIFKLRKYSGTTETEIASVTCDTISGSTISVGKNARVTGEMVITNNVHFKIGDKLRLTVEQHYTLTNVGGGDANVNSVSYWHDPTNRLSATNNDSDTYKNSSILYVDVPFRMNQ